MENALWNGKLISASEISQNYVLEKSIRKASQCKQLCCPDSECQSPELRYCHGEVKGAYFAHKNNDNCDYALFDEENTYIMKTVKKTLYDSFKKRGYTISSEVKILKHHYTHLVFELTDHHKIALEIGTQAFTVNKIESLVNEYQERNIPVKWIVIGDINYTLKENQTYFIKRYLLNQDKYLIVITPDCSEVVQYKMDFNKYLYNEKALNIEKYPEMYYETSTLDNLIFDENNDLTIDGFKQRFDEWLKNKKTAFDKEVQQRERESDRRLQEIHRNALEKECRYRESQKQKLLNKQKTTIKPNNVFDVSVEVMAICRHCGEIASMNNGVCSNCGKHK